MRSEDGIALYSMGRPTATSFILGNAGVENMLRDCDGELLMRWTSSEVPSAEELAEHLKDENGGKSADWHGDAAQIEHEESVKAAAGNIGVKKENPHEKIVERNVENAATYQRVIEKYK